MEQTLVINGDRLKKLRKSLGLTQGEFGKPINLTASFISQLENNIKGISLKNLKQISEYYNQPLEYFTDTHFSNKNGKGKLIRSLRVNKKIRPDEVAVKAGIDILDYYSIENDTLEPTKNQLEKICEVLAIDVGMLTEDIVNNLNQVFIVLRNVGLKSEALEAIKKFVYREIGESKK